MKPHTLMLVIYREYRPSGALRPFVERLWSLEGTIDGARADPIPPDGHAEIVVHAADPFSERVRDGTSRVQARVLLAGQMTRAVHVSPRGVARTVGARLHPTAAHKLFRVPQPELTDQIAELQDVDRRLARSLDQDVAGRENIEQMVQALDRALLSILPTNAESSAAERAVAIALKQRGLVRVAGVAQLLELSARQLERVFQERVGIGPKMFLRIIRFQEVLRALGSECQSKNWADLAVSLGFYDQSHFIRDFKTFAGESPGAWSSSAESLTTIFSAISRRPDIG